MMETQAPQDVSKTITFDLANGNQLLAQRKDPYGFWTMHLKHGQLPPTYANDCWSTYDELMKAVTRYKSEKQTEVVEVTDTVAKQELKRKK